MKKLFSLQIIKQSIGKVWVWALVAIVGQSFNFLLIPSEIEKGAPKTELLTSFAKDCLVFNGIVFVMIIALVCAYFLVTSEVERGTLSVILNTPTTRKQIIFSKLLVFVGALTAVCLAIGLIGTASPLMHGRKAEFDFAKWWISVALWFMYSVFVGGIAFAIGCWFNKSRYAVGLAAIILGAFFMAGMIAEMDKFRSFKYLTPQTLFNVDAIIEGKSVVWQLIALPLVAIPLYFAGVMRFLKKDLPI